MSEKQPPKIEFPCEYGIKVIGDAAPDFEAFVVSVVERHAPGIKEEHIAVNDSSKGRFSSIRLTIMATGEEQLKALFDELKASGRVHMVL